MEKLELLKEIKNDFFEKYNDVLLKQEQDIENEIKFYANDNLENLFDLIETFLSSEGDKTTQQAVVLEIMNTALKNDIPFSKECFFESPIEYLLFMALQKTMPYHISKQAYLLPQVEVCDKKYRLDFGLIKRSVSDNDDEKGLLIGIECDGYDVHYGTSHKAAKTAERIRNIKMSENIEVFQYTGKEIYANSVKLANEFWEYVEANLFPRASTELYADFDSVCALVSRYFNNPEKIEDFYVYQYEHIDVLDFMPSSNAVLGKYKGYNIILDKIKKRFVAAGWEGDGEIQLLWLPPFCDNIYADTFGVLTWFVKQDNNGTAFICSPMELPFERFGGKY